MIRTDQDKIRQQIQALVKHYGSDRSALMPILQAMQREYGHVSSFTMQAVADELDVHPVEIHGVVSFYSFLTSEPQGRFVIRLCQTITCDMAGKDRIARQLENDLGIAFGETTPDGMFTLEWANCLGMCDQGPAMLINDKVYTRVTPESVADILAECRSAMSPYAMQKQEEPIG